MVGGDAGLEALQPLGVAQDRRGRRRTGPPRGPRRPGPDGQPLARGSVSRRPSPRHWRTASSQAARLKMNTMAGSRSSSSSCSSELGAPRGAEAAPGTCAPGRPPRQAAGGGVGGAARPPGPAAGPRRPARPSLEQVDQLGAAASRRWSGEVVAQGHRPAPLDDHVGRPADRAQPRPELGGVGHRGREADEGHLGRARGRGPPPTPRRGRGPGGSGPRRGPRCARPSSRAEPASSMLRRTSVVITTTGASGRTAVSPVNRPTRPRPWVGRQLAELLVGERLERASCRRPCRRRPRARCTRVGGHQGLARAGGGRHQDRAAGVERVEGLGLEGVGREAGGSARSGAGRAAVLGSRPRGGGGPARVRSTAEELPDQDGQEVEDDQRHRQGQHREGVRARGEDGGHQGDGDDRPPPPAEQLGSGVTTPASSRATRTTGNSKVSPKSTIISRIRLRYWLGL